MVAHKNDINKKKLNNDIFLCSNKNYYKPRSKMKTEYGTLGENISENNTVPINKGHIFISKEKSLWKKLQCSEMNGEEIKDLSFNYAIHGC